MSGMKFIMGAVSCGKTMQLILTADQLRRTLGKDHVMVVKSTVDTRPINKDTIESATGLKVHASHLLTNSQSFYDMDYKNVRIILVDEIQFFSIQQIVELREISILHKIEVLCFGLLKDFKCKLFPSSQKLLELCDSVDYITSRCLLCNNLALSGQKIVPNKATCSMKINRVGDSYEPIVEGDSICIGGIETYIPVCYQCYSLTTKIVK
jgi:thymidine kinase